MFDAYQTAIADTGFNVTGDIAAEVSLDYMDSSARINLSIPITMLLDLDVFNDAAHGTITVSSSIFDANFSADMELYNTNENGIMKAYTSDNGDDWSIIDTENYNGFGRPSEIAKAEFAKGEGVYTVTVRLSELMDEKRLKEFLGEMSGKIADVGPAYIEDILNNSEVIYTFDAKTNYLLSVHMDEHNYGTFVIDSNLTTGEQNFEGTADPGIPLGVSISLAIDLTFDDYGNITADSVSAPDSVKDSAANWSYDSIVES